ncbi:hypothetical protein PoB_005919400 [Plakobranchus ocellatus]|uniref:Uncharacterized protein n=1 Tax=Plakobranchus ocellatus TaxID=259542 RepID=A0AAV4CIS0_9GAST|nr:hypothetical protein PoB_005919400 [Plakobranchus ocellatus]
MIHFMARSCVGRRIKNSLAASAQNQRHLETDLGEVNKGKDQVIKDTQKLNTAMAQVEQASDAAEAMSHFNTVRQRSQALGASSKKMVEKSKNFCERSKSQMNHLESVAKHSLQLWLHHQEKRDQEMQDLQNRMQNMESELRRNTSSRMADGESDSDSGAETEGL